MDDKKLSRMAQLLVDQSDLVDILGEDYETNMTEFVVPCIGQLAIAASEEHQRKMINKAICMKSRSDEPLVRLTSIALQKELYNRLGDDMLIYFPESIPFIAELMEDPEEEVEIACQELCEIIQEYLGEPIQQYFSA
jgi:U3 small nucleolar RNA-associated protein 10